MSEPVEFNSTSPRIGLPFLFSGQAQKEFFVNEALARTDALVHCAVEGETPSPPANPVDGENWLVASAASGEWQGKGGQLACRQQGGWLLVEPFDGMRILNRSNGQDMRFFNGWQKAEAPVEPFGGSTVDSEARAAVASVIAALRALGVFPAA